MHILPRVIILSILLACLPACSAAPPPRPPGSGPFARGPSAPPAGDPATFWAFAGGLALGTGLALMARSWRQRRIRQGKATWWLPGDLARLRAALALLRDLQADWQRRDKVVSLSQWLRRRKVE